MNADEAFERAKSEFLAGLACQQAQDFAQAERHYLASLERLPGRPSTLVNLAATRLQLGRPEEALTSAEAALASEPDSPDALLHRGSALALLGRVDEALATFERLTQYAPDHPLAWSHRGSLLRELGRTDEARAAFQQALRCGADPEMHRYYLAGVGSQDPPPSPPRAYVERLFDGYAGDFDEHLVGKLGYCAHTGLVERVGACLGLARAQSALDLGCGTGLCGPLLRPLSQRLTGLDLSSRMLARSRERGVYDQLVQADAAEFLAGAPTMFDLVVAADVLIYIGDPGPLLAALGHAMPSGLLALTVEVCDDAPGGACWQLLPSLRYAHVPARLLALARQHGFDALKVERAPVRHDQGRPVDGLYVVLQRTPA